MTAAKGYLSNVALIPQVWQPTLHNWNVHHCSSPDFAKAGWRKWSAIEPHWFDRKTTSRHPDWYTRRVNNVRRTNYKALNYNYDLPQKPTSRQFDNFISASGEVMRKKTAVPLPPNRSFKGKYLTRVADGALPEPHWGRYHPHHYEIPITERVKPRVMFHMAIPARKFFFS